MFKLHLIFVFGLFSRLFVSLGHSGDPRPTLAEMGLGRWVGICLCLCSPSPSHRSVWPLTPAPNAALVGDESPSWGTIHLQALLEKNNNNNNLNKTTK